MAEKEMEEGEEERHKDGIGGRAIFNLIISTFNLIIFSINDKIELTYDDIDAIL